jgi:hypothetical protein
MIMFDNEALPKCCFVREEDSAASLKSGSSCKCGTHAARHAKAAIELREQIISKFWHIPM